MELWTAFLLGLAGSVHCAGMCGPLVIALARSRPQSLQASTGRLLYHLGRVASYVLMGLALGLIGQAAAPAGFQRWLSLGLGVSLLIALLLGNRLSLSSPILKGLGWVKGSMRSLLQRQTLPAQGLLGALNGLLPCGLVYVAAVGATASGSPLSGALYMGCFGLGTWPMMLGIHFAGQKLPLPSRLLSMNTPRLALLMMGLLLVLRGMELGIPYLSPTVSNGCAHCH